MLSEEDVKLAHSGLAALGGWVTARPALAMSCLNLPGAPPFSRGPPPPPPSETFHRVGSVRGFSYSRTEARVLAYSHECQFCSALRHIWTLRYGSASQGNMAVRYAGVSEALMDALLCADKAQPKAAAQEVLTQVAARVPRGRAWLLRTLAASEVPCSYAASTPAAVSRTLGLYPADTHPTGHNISIFFGAQAERVVLLYLMSDRTLIRTGRTPKDGLAAHAGFRLLAHMIAAVQSRAVDCAGTG